MMILKNKCSSKIVRPLFTSAVSCGFPSPAEHYVEGDLDLNEHLIKNPVATFFIRASGHSMIGAGIFSGDILIVDRALKPVNNSIVVAAVYGDLTVKRLKLCTKGIESYLVAESPNYAPIKINQESNVSIWGVATYAIHNLREKM